MSVCSHPECDAVAVLQWQRAGSDAEASAHVRGLHVQQMEMVNYQRARLALEVDGLLERRRSLVERGQTSPVVLATVDRMVAGKQAELDAVPDPAPGAVMPVTVAVFTCEEHAVDLESAALLHETGCMAEGRCGCTLG